MNNYESRRVALFVNFDAKPGGAERRFVRFFLKSKSPELRLILNQKGKKRLQDSGLRIEDDRVVEFDYQTSRYAFVNKILVFLSLWRVIFSNKIKHVHYPIDPSVYTFLHAFLSRLTGVSYSISMVDSSRTQRSDLGGFQYYLWKYSLRRAERLDILSDGILTNMRRIFGELPKYEISPCSFTDYTNSRIGIKKDYDFVLMNRLVEGKGLDLFFDALRVVSEMGLASRIGRIGIFGDGPLKKFAEEAAAALPDFSIELGYANDPFDIFSRSKIFLSLQKSENYPSQSILEALSCGALIVATDVGETYRIVPDSVGIRVKSDPHELANACLDALQRWGSGNHDPSSSVSFVKKSFSAERFCNYFESFLFR